MARRCCRPAFLRLRPSLRLPLPAALSTSAPFPLAGPSASAYTHTHTNYTNGDPVSSPLTQAACNATGNATMQPARAPTVTTRRTRQTAMHPQRSPNCNLTATITPNATPTEMQPSRNPRQRDPEVRAALSESRWWLEIYLHPRPIAYQPYVVMSAQGCPPLRGIRPRPCATCMPVRSQKMICD